MGWKASSGRPSWGGFFLFNRGVWQIPQHQSARPSTILHMIGIEFGGSTMTTPSDKNTLYVLLYSLAGTVLSLAATWFFVDLRSRWLLRQDSRMSNRSRKSAVLYLFLGLATSWLLRKDAKK